MRLDSDSKPIQLVSKQVCPFRPNHTKLNKCQRHTHMSNLEKSLNFFLGRHKEGSFSTHANRSLRLNQIVNTLKTKYRNLNDIQDLKTRHIDYLVQKWLAEELNSGTIKNRMSDLRWIARKINKDNIVKRSNREYNIPDRTYVKNDTNIAKRLSEQELERINDRYSRYSLRLQQAFGLRREESIKFDPGYADKGDRITLKDSWCKGGRAREVPIRTPQQRALLDEIRAFCKAEGATALIPPDRNYRQQLKCYEKQVERNDLMKNHGLRHQYTQDRYKEMTGQDCPKQGGKRYFELSPEEKQRDLDARLQISAELGHNREEITAVYLGR